MAAIIEGGIRAHGVAAVVLARGDVEAAAQRRAAIEAELIAARRHAAELQNVFRRAEEAHRRGETGAASLFAIRDRALALASEIGLLEGEALALERALVTGESAVTTDDGAIAAIASLRTSAELDEARQEILGLLRDLAEPIARFNHLAERQRGLTARVRATTGADNGYAAYLDTALFRAIDLDSVVEFVIETVRKARVVA